MKLLPFILTSAFLFSASSAEIVFLAHPAQPVPAEKTVIWSPLLQATWDQMNLRLGGKPKGIVPPNPLMTQLDDFRWKVDQVMPEEAWKTWSGTATPEFLETVNREAGAMLRSSEPTFTIARPDPQRLAFFGLLDREIMFKREMYRAKVTSMIFHEAAGGKPVSFFGVRGRWAEDFDDAVSVLSWRPSVSSHAIQIRCRDGDDTVILYLPSEPHDFTTACEWIRTWRRAIPEPLGEHNPVDPSIIKSVDEVRIPYLAFDTSADLATQLKGVRDYGKKRGQWSIERAEMKFKFELHEKGARVRATSSLGTDPFAAPPESRQFNYDRPFFVFLWRKEAEWPYFGAWIGDRSAMKEPAPGEP